MSIKSFSAKVFANYIRIKIDQWASHPEEVQKQVFENLLKKAKNTLFGKDHDFKNIKNYQDFAKKVPIRDYEELKPYVDKMVSGEPDILWPGKPLYYAKTS
ncbi:MAG: GH3 auxin-responsive promoter family protein, partial [Gillisia sp.]|nr:GH3 auxin-responsive promoter family protein [Gillisia sp.]